MPKGFYDELASPPLTAVIHLHISLLSLPRWTAMQPSLMLNISYRYKSVQKG